MAFNKNNQKENPNKPNQRIGIFIDVVNLYHSAKNIFHGRVNYQELIKNIVGNRQMIRAMAYVVKSEGNPGEQSFFEALEKSGLELRSKELSVYPDGTKKGDWDVGLAVDAIRMSKNLDAVILVTGDGDFVPLVEYLKWGAGLRVEVAGFSSSASRYLQEAADRFIPIEQIPRVIIKK